jgi:hypothetical protein
MKKIPFGLALVFLILPAYAQATLYSNSATGNVGIGTTSPQSLLHVYGGEVEVGSSGASCAATNAGGIRYSGGTLYYCNATAWTSLGGNLPSLTNDNIWIGNGSNVATAVAVSGDCTIANTGVITCTATNGTPFGTLATQYGVNLSSQATGTLQAGQFPALTGDVTTTAGSLATTVAAIQGTTISGTTGTGNAVLSASPTLTGTIAAAAANFSGNVGIGTGNPLSTPLLVNGAIKTLADTSGSGVLVYGRASDSSVWAPLAFQNDLSTFEGGFFWTTTGVTLDIGPSLTSAITILNSGNVGVGTTSPATALQVVGTITATALGNGITATTQSVGDTSTKVATDAFVNTTALTLANGTTATTQSAGDNSTKVATTAYVQASTISQSVASIQTFTSSGTWTKPSGVGSNSVTLGRRRRRSRLLLG